MKERKKKAATIRAQIVPNHKKKALSPCFTLSDPLLARTVLIYAENVSHRFGKPWLFKDINLEIRARQRIAITGENGVGKTTLIRILTGDLTPASGNVRRNARLHFGWFQQEHEGLNPASLVIEEAERACLGQKARAKAALSHFLFKQDQWNQAVKTLSRGEMSRLALCKLMLGGFNALILDEPSNHLDPDSRQALAMALSVYEGALVIVSHDEKFLDQVGISHFLEMPKGSLFQTGADPW